MVQLDRLRRRAGPAQLSGGQQQRVALARALVFEPKLVLMDEPLGALDKQLREQMQLEIRHLHQRLGVTVVYVTHDQAEALTMSDRIAVFHAGRDPAARRRRRALYEQPAQRLRRPLHRREQPAARARCETIGGARLHGAARRTARDRRARAADVGAAGSARHRLAAAGARADRATGASGGGRVNRCRRRLQELIYLGDHVRALCRAGRRRRSCMVKLPIDAGRARWPKVRRSKRPGRPGRACVRAGGRRAAASPCRSAAAD